MDHADNYRSSLSPVISLPDFLRDSPSPSHHETSARNSPPPTNETHIDPFDITSTTGTLSGLLDAPPPTPTSDYNDKERSDVNSNEQIHTALDDFLNTDQSDRDSSRTLWNYRPDIFSSDDVFDNFDPTKVDDDDDQRYELPGLIDLGTAASGFMNDESNDKSDTVDTERIVFSDIVQEERNTNNNSNNNNTNNTNNSSSSNKNNANETSDENNMESNENNNNSRTMSTSTCTVPWIPNAHDNGTGSSTAVDNNSFALDFMAHSDLPSSACPSSSLTGDDFPSFADRTPGVESCAPSFVGAPVPHVQSQSESGAECFSIDDDGDEEVDMEGEGEGDEESLDEEEYTEEQDEHDEYHREFSKPPTTARITLEDLKKVFDLERPKAEKKLNLKRTTFSNLSRHFGISKWPYRTIRDVRNRQHANEVILRQGSISKEKRRKLLEQQKNLDAVIDLIYTDPTESRDSNTLAVLLKIVEARRKGGSFG